MRVAGRAKVFVVDDERIIAATLSLILNTAGYEATAFTSPEQALSAGRAAPPDILLSDLRMPGMSGLELAEALLRHAPRCRVVLLSGDAAPAGLPERGGHRFHRLAKPVRPGELLACLARLTASAEVDAE